MGDPASPGALGERGPAPDVQASASDRVHARHRGQRQVQGTAAHTARGTLAAPTMVGPV